MYCIVHYETQLHSLITRLLVIRDYLVLKNKRKHLIFTSAQLSIIYGAGRSR